MSSITPVVKRGVTEGKGDIYFSYPVRQQVPVSTFGVKTGDIRTMNQVKKAC